MLQISYINYLAILFFLTGILVLTFDTKQYKKEQKNKEETWSRVLGWTNIAAGILVYVGFWAVQQWVV